jgi:hypothetical protein
LFKNLKTKNIEDTDEVVRLTLRFQESVNLSDKPREDKTVTGSEGVSSGRKE